MFNVWHVVLFGLEGGFLGLLAGVAIYPVLRKTLLREH